ncbi:glycoside hydrolase [Pasteurellaceae bacterium Pebbles2]|nr:glycoside hydrolase [Pasteurellaceae bacterium Pebbles2]
MNNRKATLLKYGCSVLAIIALVKLDYSEQIRTTEAGLKIIGNAEGCVRQPYKCPADVLTYGIGTAETSGEKIIQGKVYSDEEIAKSWVKNIKIAEQCVNRYANGKQLPQGAFEAATSLTFNVGCSAVKNSTLFRYARQGDIQAMCNQFPRWVYSGGKVLRGLEIRRQQEKARCLVS